MLIGSRKYLFQIIRAADGVRAEPFIMTPAELQENIIRDYNSENDNKFYVLVLADINENIKPQEFVSKFPLFTLESWANLTFNTEEPKNG